MGIIKIPLGQRLNLPRPEDDANLLHLIKLKGERESLGNSPVVLSRRCASRLYLSVFVILLYTIFPKSAASSTRCGYVKDPTGFGNETAAPPTRTGVN